MVNVLFKLIVMQPQALLTHVQNYAALMGEGMQHALMTWRLRLMFYALSATCLLLGMASCAGALLLWGALPVLHPHNAWVLVALPVVLWLASVAFYMVAQRYQMQALFEDVQEQLKLDMLALCQAQQAK